MPQEDPIWQDPITRAYYLQIDSGEIASLKQTILASGPTTADW